jgi:hypothetical protein
MHLPGMFPDIPGQPGFNKSRRAAGPLIADRRGDHGPGPGQPVLARSPALVDSTPLPCGTTRETLKRSDLAGQPAMAIAPPTPGSSGACGSL